MVNAYPLAMHTRLSIRDSIRVDDHRIDHHWSILRATAIISSWYYRKGFLRFACYGRKTFRTITTKTNIGPASSQVILRCYAGVLGIGHMSPATSNGVYFIPQHAIYCLSDIIPKINVVLTYLRRLIRVRRWTIAFFQGRNCNVMSNALLRIYYGH